MIYMMDKVKGIVFVTFVLFVVLCVLITYNGNPQNKDLNNALSDDSISQNDDFTISHKQIKQKGSMSDFDATNENIYFSYSEKGSVVDVFDNQGNYLYSITFADQEKGNLLVRCKNGKLFVRQKNGCVKVFSDIALTDSFSKEVATKNGMDYQWFTQAPESIKLKGIKFYRIDPLNGLQSPIPIPGYVIISYYMPYVLCVIVILIFVLTLLNKFRQGKTRDGDVSRIGFNS